MGNAEKQFSGFPILYRHDGSCTFRRMTETPPKSSDEHDTAETVEATMALSALVRALARAAAVADFRHGEGSGRTAATEDKQT